MELVVKLSVRVSSEERNSNLGKGLLGNHGQPSLQRVVNLDLALVCIKLNASSAERETVCN